ncbi:MAG: hypothetical protein OXJ55_05260 [Caldilineaceae bacterium]|nr:hypothetical protein [Caldilineaceae bacterium]MDE0464333.1 hypothetical protein [Caldilineaceae bacterium]
MMRILMARTLGEKIQGSTTRWLVLPAPGSAGMKQAYDNKRYATALRQFLTPI